MGWDLSVDSQSWDIVTSSGQGMTAETAPLIGTIFVWYTILKFSHKYVIIVRSQAHQGCKILKVVLTTAEFATRVRYPNFETAKARKRCTVPVEYRRRS